MSTSASGAGSQVFVLVGPLASRIAASLSPQQSAPVNESTTAARLLLEATNSPQTLNLSSGLSEQLGAALGQLAGQQDDPLSATAAPLQHHRHLRPLHTLELQQQQELATSGTLMNSLTNIATSYNQQEAQSLAATLARLGSWQLLLVIALIALILISIVGNCLVCVAIFTDRRLRKLGNAFIVSLAIADLFVSCLVMTFALCNDLMDWWMFGERFCDIWISFDIMCCTASILNLCAISLDRFIHIKDCLLYNQLMTRRVALSAVLGIWLISALVSFVPINLGWHKPNHFKSRSPLAPPPPTLTQNIAPSVPLMNASDSFNETQAILLAATSEPNNDNLMHGERVRRRATPFELRGSAATRSEKSDIQGASAAGQQSQHFHHHTQFAQAAAHELRPPAGETRSANKDFVPTEGRPALRATTNGQSPAWPSSGLNGHAEPNWRRAPAQVDLGAGLRAPRPAPNYYDSNRAASETGPAKQSDDQVEFNPPDGPSCGREQIKAQVRKKRLANESEAEPPPAQTERSSGRRPSSATTLLDHPDERPTMGDSEQAPIKHEAHLVRAEPGPQRENGPQRRPLEPATEGGGGAASAATDPSADHGHLPQCMLTLTPTYAIISSTISFYIPCLIMLGLYSKLFACARRHVRNIRAITRAPHPIATTTARIGPQAGANAPRNGASPATQLESRPCLAAEASSSSRRGRSSQSIARPDTTASRSAPDCQRRPPLVSRARTWLKFATKRSPSGNHGEHGASDGTRQRAGTPAQSAGPIACRDNSTSANSSSSSPANDRLASCSPSLPIAQRLSTTSGANEKTIDLAAAREDEPFLGGQAAELHDKLAVSSNKNHCDNANDSLLTRAPSNAAKSASSGTKVKLNLAPSEFQHQQRQASQLQQQQHKQQQTSQLATHKAAITLGIIMGTFLFCWVPFFCLNIIKAFYVDSIPGSMFRAFTWLGYANSALNPIIYGIHNSEFRNAFNRIFFKHLSLKNGRHYLNRRFSYDVRPHHHQTRQQHAHQQQQQHQSRHGTNHKASCVPSDAPLAGSTNHQLGARPAQRPDLSTDKH